MDWFDILDPVTEVGGANCLVTICPLCHMNLEMYQSRINQKYHTRFNLPILFFTQIMGQALGISPRDLGFQYNIISVDSILVDCR